MDPGMLNPHATPDTLPGKGRGHLSIAQAPIDNDEAWAGDSAYDRVTGLAEEGELTTKATDGEEQVPDPAGADLWQSQVTGTDSVELEWNDEANRTGFLIAGEGDPGQVK